LDMEKLNAEKQQFMKDVIPQWIDEALVREKTYPTSEL